MIIEEIKEEFRKGNSQIKRIFQIEGNKHLSVRMTNIKGESINSGTPIDDLDIGLQPLILITEVFSPKDGRVDKDQGYQSPIHQHIGAEKIYFTTTGNKTASYALGMILGHDCWKGI